jgi:hypothetical protein
MNKPFRNILYSLTFAIALTSATGAVPPPEAPYVATPRPGTGWDIQVGYENATNATPASGRQLLNIHCHCGKSATHIVAKWSDGTTNEAYVIGKRFVQKNPQTGAFITLPVQDADLEFPVFTSGYQATAWLSAENYQGVDSRAKTSCYKFQKIASKKSAAATDNNSAEEGVAAWISVKDKTPVFVQVRQTRYEFSAIQPAENDVELPAEYAAFLEKIRKEEAALEFLHRHRNTP